MNSTELTEAQIDYLLKFISEERKERFNKILSLRTRHITVALENITDSHNISAVMRSCECFGIQEMHIIEKDKAYKTAKNVANGAYKWININKYSSSENNSRECIISLKRRGYKIVATSPHIQEQSIQNLNLNQPVALFFGQERDGISEIVRDEADEFVIIPMHGFSESFNISVAASIMLYELTTRLRNDLTLNWQLSAEDKMSIKTDWILKSIYRPDLILKRYADDHQRG